MREFIVRARHAPVDADRFRQAIGSDAHVEYLSQVVVNALLISKGHRPDTRLTLVLEDSDDFSRAVCLDGGSLGSLPGWHESAIVDVLCEALVAGRRLHKEERITVADGISIAAISFEHLVRSMSGVKTPEQGESAASRLFILDRKGEDIRASRLPDDPVFVMTDHIPMPRKTLAYLYRLGAHRLSLGPIMLQTSQCVTVLHNELDRPV